uniref:Uncharacterized protein n=1 Tax=Triticum urartu TaxID=4572 RepID=A0A8R7V7U6_TRIUA
MNGWRPLLLPAFLQRRRAAALEVLVMVVVARRVVIMAATLARRVFVVITAPARRVGAGVRARLAALLVRRLLLAFAVARARVRRRCGRELRLGGPAGDRLGEERGPLVAGHDDHHVLLEIRGRLGRAGRRGLLPVGVARRLAIGGAVEEPGELPVGAGEDEQREGDEAQHRRQPAEEVRHRRLPRRVRRRRRRRRPREAAHGQELCSGPHGCVGVKA